MVSENTSNEQAVQRRQPAPEQNPAESGGKQLIVQAFRQARDSGKSDWFRMTTAVLKNRLLGLTDKKFTEADYGASSLTDFVSRFSDMLNIDRDQFPMVVELKLEERTSVDPSGVSNPSRNIRIRQDLWRAIFDRSSGNTYYWLSDTGDVSTSPTDENCPLLPIIDAETDRQWRQSFLASLSFIPDEVTEWANSLLPLFHLPLNLRYQWNRALTEQVRQRLLGWFKGHGLEPPSDFIAEVGPHQNRHATDLEALRRLIQRVVQEMTEEELSQLSLPPRAVLNATTPRRP